MNKIESTLMEVGMPAGVLGFGYVVSALEMAARDPKCLRRMTTELYPEVAKMHDTTSSRVERAIRHAVELAFDRGAPDVLERYFFNSTSPAKGKPTNREFLATIALHLKNDKGAAIYAVFNHPTYGRSNDGEYALKAGLNVGGKYPVEKAEVGGFHSSVFLRGIAGSFNSVLFDFEDENGDPVNVYGNPDFRRY